MRGTLLMGWIALFMSLSIAACAAYFSITGLAVLFAAVPLITIYSFVLNPVIIMATVLEVGKVFTTFLLHRFWSDIPFQIKYPLSGMVIILMILTSAGIFGFMTKGHLDQEAPVANITSQISATKQQISSYENNITIYQDQLDQINRSLKILLDYDKISGPDGYLARQKTLEPDITRLQELIRQEQQKIQNLRDQQLQSEVSINEIESKLGPIKYVAEFFGYDLENDPDGKGKAVRIVILLFMLAFDPLAIWLVMTSDWIFIKYRRERQEILQEEIDERDKDELKGFIEELNSILEEKEMEIKNFEKNIEELDAKIQEYSIKAEKTDKLEFEVTDLRKKKEQYENDLLTLRNDLTASQQSAEELRKILSNLRSEMNEIKASNKNLTKEIERRDVAIQSLNEKYDVVEKPELKTRRIVSAFGNNFPNNPPKGQMFLYVDEETNPSILYRFDGQEWIAIQKDDSVEYSSKYLNYLIDEIKEERIEFDDLSNKEKKDIEKLLDNVKDE